MNNSKGLSKSNRELLKNLLATLIYDLTDEGKEKSGIPVIVGIE